MTRRLALVAALLLLALTGCATTSNTPQEDPQRITSPADATAEEPPQTPHPQNQR